jgi:molybdopterin molybdotransferase
MIKVEEAKEIISRAYKSFGAETVSLKESIFRVLQEDWYTDRDLPPYNRVTMDGIAIQYNSENPTKMIFPIVGIAPAGAEQIHLENSNACLEVMTGAILPSGTDTVIRYEDVEIEDGVAKVIANYTEGQNIHTQGQDRKSGDLIVQSGVKISPAEIGVGASIGKHEVQVAALPKVMIISTGDELIPVDEQPLQHQIRKSNVYRIAATLESYDINYKQSHLNDDLENIVIALEDYVKNYDVIILSGGVSKGKYDFVPAAMEQIGVQKLFHKIQQRPGKPFWFGTYKEQCTIFALPGNPVSSFMCTQIYFMEWLRNCLGEKTTTQPNAILQEEVYFKPDLSYFLEVEIKYNDSGQILAFPKKGNGSGDLANLSTADAFINLPQGKDTFAVGECYPIYFYR